MTDPILYGPAYSTYTRTVRLALEEKGVPYRHVEVDFMTGGMPEEHLARQPFGKVPAFEHGGLSLYETCAIGRYVDEAFDGPPLQPASPGGRARMAQIVSITDSYAYQPTIQQLVIQRLVMPKLGGAPDEAVIEAALPRIDQCMGALEVLTAEGPWLVGDALSLADLHLAPIFAYFTAMSESGPILADKPLLRTWWSGIRERPSLVSTEPQPG